MGRKDHLRVVFSILGKENTLRTIVYIDGYNLYYGCLKYSEYKWLDIYKLFSEHIIKVQSPDSTITQVKFFTADIKAKIATRGEKALQAQNSYHRALLHSYPDKISIIKGYYSLERTNLPKFQIPPNKKDRVEVWRLEEKQTDVNIALHAYRDAIKNECEQVVIVSNDTDLEPLLKMIRNDLGENIKIGIVIPINKPKIGKPHRPANKSLSQYANWTRQYLLEEELQSSLLPDMIPTKKKPIRKPDHW